MPRKKESDRPTYFKFQVEFKTKEEMEEFKNYVHSIKLSKGTPIYQTVTEMFKLHKEKYNAGRKDS